METAEKVYKKFDKGLESDKKEYIQKRAKVDSSEKLMKGNSTENLTSDDMEMMEQFNLSMIFKKCVGVFNLHKILLFSFE
ncbi:Protein CBG26263 [Caenorhabditis briggsae]|uniref:Protein CBG26263 n=1 Tax=Caenorhabditis briggsae TaxID=6238 RepID=B6IKY9_CAEBR|nr:Protein CBG26263 [Caenorhabditis briggsae]CAS00569.1 Protein CBG26263 [Caenorhabditis briggsae]